MMDHMSVISAHRLFFEYESEILFVVGNNFHPLILTKLAMISRHT